ncbi:hypothetical protein CJ030_MR1G029369 [Morella rubra]|uniref:Reverse transcriptase zinc-binding domain-containing protein n=1 Tax=Morella rubra TaxID=262757 RepID=A0A6A1WPR3_9ROSI|nr:hypothetical protein CJ030_MR1G029369 [Morella rubra]
MYRSLSSSTFVSVIAMQLSDWNKLWKLCIHARLKILLWKVAWNILPTRSRVSGVIGAPGSEGSLCPLCCEAIESLHHLLFACQFSRVIWWESPWPIDCQPFLDSPLAVWEKIILQPQLFLNIPLPEVHAFQLFASLAIDLVWFNRNLAAHGKPFADPLQLARRVQKLRLEHCAAWQPLSKAVASSVWIPLPASFCKVNVAVAIRDSFCAVACVGRTSSGLVVFACSKLFPAQTPLIGEALAAAFGIQQAAIRGVQNLKLEGDSLVVVNAFSQDPSLCPWSLDSIVANSQLIVSSFLSWEFLFSSCSANSLAHDLARWAASSLFEGSVPHSLELFGSYPWVDMGLIPLDSAILKLF